MDAARNLHDRAKAELPMRNRVPDPALSPHFVDLLADGCGVQGVGLKICSLVFGVQGAGLRVWSFKFTDHILGV